MTINLQVDIFQNHLVFLQLEMTDNVGDLLALLVRQLLLDLDWDLAATLGDHGAAAGGSGNLLRLVKW